MQQLHSFVLVHGSCHGAWCWFKVAAKLRSAGHRVTAVDLSGSGIDPRRLDDVRSISEYVEPLMEFMESVPGDERVILVGHSYGGISISLAMERFPEKISVGIFLSAYMPDHMSPPGFLIQEYFKRLPEGTAMDSEFGFEEGPENPPTSVMFGYGFLKEKAYYNCPPEDIELAKMLMRPSGLFTRDLGTEKLLTKEKYGSTKRAFIICEGDKVVPEEFQQWMIDNYQPNQVEVMNRAGHMSMFSKPDELYQLLQEIAERYKPQH